jgi:hypothetical protein
MMSAMIAPLVVLSCMLAQTPPLRVEVQPVRGPDTITPEAKKLRLDGAPPEAKLLGVFDWDGDGRDEVFAGWTVPGPSADEKENHVVVLRAAAQGSIKLVQHVIIPGTELFELWFYRPRDRRDTPKVVALLQGGATWSTVCLLRPGVDRAEELFGPNDHEFADLNGDGISEAIAWNRRPEDDRCSFGFFAVRVYPQVYVETGKQFHKVWPREDATWAQVMAQFVELDEKGTVAMIALEDNARMEAGAQRLALYRMEGDGFRLLSSVDCPWPSIAVLFSIREGTRTLDLWTTSQEHCKAGGNPDTVVKKVPYSFRNGHLQARQVAR